MAYLVKQVPTDHKDLIHDVAYDFYGKRMATCSSDEHVKVWDLNKEGEWVCTASWKAHSGSVWRVTWAHPEFGQVLATCSFDRLATVWEELGETGGNNPSQWVQKARLADSRTSVADIKFAPKCKQLGLQLATCSADGIIRIYEAPDVMNLSQWSLQHDINCKMTGCSSLSWCVPWNQPPLIAVGCNDSTNTTTPKVQIHEYIDSQRKWLKAATIMSVTDPVHDLSFAPNYGRSYHMLAIASKNMHIVGLKPPSSEASIPSSTTKFDMLQIAQSDQQSTQTWRLSWNITGTVLATCSDDGYVRLWKANYLGTWKCVKKLKGEGRQSSVIPGSPTYHLMSSSSTANRPVLSPLSHSSRVVWH